jgi:hypothetical protein
VFYGSISGGGLGIFLFSTASRTVLRPTQPPIQWVPATLSLGVKRPGREAEYSPPSSAEVKECLELYLHSPNTLSWRRAQFKNRTGTTLPLSYRKINVAQIKQNFRICRLCILHFLPNKYINNFNRECTSVA